MVNLLFDYDGTIHESLKIYAPAFRKAMQYLEQKGLKEPVIYTDEEIAYWLGFNVKEMWNTFMPKLSKEEVNTCSQLIGAEMLRLIEEGHAKLYKGTSETLEGLIEKGYKLLLLSNCKVSYLEAHKETFSLDKYFSAFYTSEEYGFRPKYKIFEEIKKYHEGEFIVIGDRYQDMEIAIKHGVSSIGCTYGYGSEEELQCADIKIDDILKLMEAEAIERVCP
ncbi:hydrolase, haloacid dehalogenase-like family protein BCZK2594 [Lachnospiraceae bacterium KM106-2]|nr:hydrolase, haloacid dehalogenase-like family protein BCZK2594 [Lachnospiraceae bacterium KM106-2]